MILEELHTSTFDCTNNIEKVSNLLSYSLGHVHRNCSDDCSNPVFQLTQIPYLCVVNIIFNITPQKKSLAGLNPVNVEAKKLDH